MHFTNHTMYFKQATAVEYSSVISIYQKSFKNTEIMKKCMAVWLKSTLIIKNFLNLQMPLYQCLINKFQVTKNRRVALGLVIVKKFAQ